MITTPDIANRGPARVSVSVVSQHLFAAAMLTILSLAQGSAAVAAEWPAGRWGGPLAEDNHGKRSYYTVIIELTEDEGRIAYPDFGCGGNLIPDRQWSGSRGDMIFSFAEKLDQGTDRCQAGGVVELRFPGTNRAAEEIGYSWTHPQYRRLTVNGGLYALTSERPAPNSCADCGVWDFLGKARCDKIFKLKWSRSQPALQACYTDVASDVQACRKRLSCE